MERVIDVANYIYNHYKLISGGDKLDEMKLHKLLYFAQRECLAITGKPMFREALQGWKYGPVSVETRHAYYEGDGIIEKTKDVSVESARMLRGIIEEYGQYTSWKLSEMSHQELSWKNARQGLHANDPGNKELKIEDIMEDAKKVRPFDHLWGMYYDEFEDLPVAEVQ